MKTIIKNLNQKTFTYNALVHVRYLENKDFVYYVNEPEESVFMFRKEDNSLASNNYFAQNALFEDMQNDNFTWLSNEANQSIKLLKAAL